jgi:hypothetical protein
MEHQAQTRLHDKDIGWFQAVPRQDLRLHRHDRVFGTAAVLLRAETFLGAEDGVHIIEQQDGGSYALLDLMTHAARELHASHRKDSGSPLLLHIGEEVRRHGAVERHSHLCARGQSM